jgi:hypothetical protein
MIEFGTDSWVKSSVETNDFKLVQGQITQTVHFSKIMLLMVATRSKFQLFCYKICINNEYVHTASYLKGAGGSFPGLKCPRCKADHLPPSGAEPGQLYIHSTVGLHSKHKDNFTVIVPRTKRWWIYKKHFQNYMCSKVVFIVPLFLFCIANKACVYKNHGLLHSE